MESQVRSLHAVDDGRGARVALGGPVEPRRAEGRGDVAGGDGLGLVRGLAGFGVVGRQGVGAAEVDGAAAAACGARGGGAEVG